MPEPAVATVLRVATQALERLQQRQSTELRGLQERQSSDLVQLLRGPLLELSGGLRDKQTVASLVERAMLEQRFRWLSAPVGSEGGGEAPGCSSEEEAAAAAAARGEESQQEQGGEVVARVAVPRVPTTTKPGATTAPSATQWLVPAARRRAPARSARSSSIGAGTAIASLRWPFPHAQRARAAAHAA